MSHQISIWATRYLNELVHLEWATTTFPKEPPHVQIKHHIFKWSTTFLNEPQNIQGTTKSLNESQYLSISHHISTTRMSHCIYCTTASPVSHHISKWATKYIMSLRISKSATNCPMSHMSHRISKWATPSPIIHCISNWANTFSISHRISKWATRSLMSHRISKWATRSLVSHRISKCTVNKISYEKNQAICRLRCFLHTGTSTYV